MDREERAESHNYKKVIKAALELPRENTKKKSRSAPFFSRALDRLPVPFGIFCRNSPSVQPQLHVSCGQKTMQTIKELCDVVRQTAYDIHVYHGHGHLEKVYERALVHRLSKLGLNIKQQHPLNV
jgi:GxxExxY protein